MRIYSNNRRGENTLDRMKITIRVPGNEKFGIITHFERPSVHNAPYTYDHEFSEAQIDFDDQSITKTTRGSSNECWKICNRREKLQKYLKSEEK